MELVYPPVVLAFRSLFAAYGWDVQVHDEHHLPKDGPAVIATNHVGYLDFAFVGLGAWHRNHRRFVRFAAKKEVFDNAVAGPLMRGMHHIPVDRFGRATAAIDEGVQRLRDGDWVGMFPEGTINTSFVPTRGRSGAVRMAQEAGVPIVPGAVWGSQRILTKGRPRNLQRDVVVSVAFGEPMAAPEDADANRLTDQLMERIGQLTDRLQRDYPQEPDGPDDRWWQPAHLGGTAPTPEEARAYRREESARRRAKRAEELDRRK